MFNEFIVADWQFNIMFQLNHNIYNMMKKLEDQHSTKPFIVKGLNR